MMQGVRSSRDPLVVAALGAALGGCTQGTPRATGGVSADHGAIEPSTVRDTPADNADPSTAGLERGVPAVSAAPLPAGLERGDPPEAQRARVELVREIETFERPWGEAAWDPRVLDALRRVPRHLFAPGLSMAAAYRDVPQPIGHDQTISQPTIVAVMSAALRLGGRERVLEIGTGSGYQAAVLSLLCGSVYSIELVEPLGLAAKDRLARLGYRNVQVRIGDGYRGWPEAAPFDRIIVTAAPPELPAELGRELRPGGILVAPVGKDAQMLVRYTKRPDGELEQERLGRVLFVPMVPGPSASPSPDARDGGLR
jgi:protein-L-isoaspartate(D-aspartate) O-methyltransferase